MKRRGRPRHPDILTPREWEVLALLRDGLANPEIAERLGVTRDAVKYHVSEILSKLGVTSREEAAIWRPSERPWWAAAAAALGDAARRLPPLGRIAAISVSVAVLAGLGLLAWAVLVTRGSSENGDSAIAGQPPASPEQSLAPSPTPPVPDVLAGVTITPLGVGPPVDLPENVALIIETGCWGCAGWPQGLIRAYKRPDGSITRDTLLDTVALGVTPQQLTRPDGTAYEQPAPITGYAISPSSPAYAPAVGALAARVRRGILSRRLSSSGPWTQESHGLKSAHMTSRPRS